MQYKVPRIAIITRTKDRPLFLERAMATVDGQTCNDYVHIIYNDGGDPAVVDALIGIHPNKRRVVIHSNVSKGLVYAMNEAIKKSESDYIIALDDDDYWDSELIEKALSVVDNYGSKIIAIPFDIINENIKNNKIVSGASSHSPYSCWSGEITLYKQLTLNYLSAGATLYKRSLIKEVGYYDESLEIGEDWDFGIRIATKADVDKIYCDKSLMFYSKRYDESDAIYKNSTANMELKERTIARIRDKYMRKDIVDNKLGIGYIMNNSEYDLLNVIRIEGHINNILLKIQPNKLRNINKLKILR